MKKFVGSFFFILLSFSAVSQSLEEKLYTNLDVLTKNPSSSSLSIFIKQLEILSKTTTTKNDALALVISYCNLGYYSNQYSSLKESITAYETAWKIYENYQFSNYDINDNCLIPLARLYIKTGEYIKAENTIKTYVTKAEEKNKKTQKINGILNLSTLYNSTGRFNAAIQTIMEADKLNTIPPSEQQKLQNNLATGYIGLVEYTTAKKILKEILLKFKESHVTTYKSLAFIALQEKNSTEAQQYFNFAKAELLKQQEFTSRDLALLHLEEANMYFQLHKLDESNTSLTKALQTLLPFYDEKTFPNVKELYAESIFTGIFDLKAKLTENRTDALAWYKLSFFITNERFRSWSSQENKIIHQAEQKNRTERCLELLLALYKETKNEQYLTDAFQFAEAVKSGVLSERLLKNNLIENTLDPLLVKEQEIEKQQEIIIDKLVRSQLLKVEDTKALNTSLNTVALQLTSIRNEIKNKYPTINSTISVASLQQKLKVDNAVLLSYFYGKENIYVFMLDAKNITLSKIEITPDFEATLQKFIHYFDNPSAINNDVHSYTQIAHLVYKNLFFNKAGTYVNVLVIPDGLLSFVSFESLLTQPTTTTSYTEMPFVVKEHKLVYATTAIRYFKWEKAVKKPSVLGVFPVFPDSAQNLAYSINEANYLKEAVNATLLLEEKASKMDFFTAMEGYNVLHLSTHANSGNFVIPASIDFYDDTLFMNEIYATNFSSKSIVLSACDTGIGKLQKGEGALSLARGFQYAGATELLFTLWKVNDKSSSEVMRYFYTDYKKTNAMFIANTSSKLNYLKDYNITNAKKSPYYWNGFVYYGGFEIPKKTVPYFYILIVGVLVLTAFLLFYYRKRK